MGQSLKCGSCPNACNQSTRKSAILLKRVTAVVRDQNAIDGPFEIAPRTWSYRSRRRSESFLEGADFEFHRPRARILVREMPVGLCDRLGFEKVAVFQARLQSARTRDVDAAIHVDPGYVNAFGAEVARQRLREATHRELRGSKRDR